MPADADRARRRNLFLSARAPGRAAGNAGARRNDPRAAPGDRRPASRPAPASPVAREGRSGERCRIAPGDRHRVERALEVWIAAGRPISSWPSPTSSTEDALPSIRIGIRAERARLVKVLDARVDAMYAAGLVEETRALLERWPRSARPFGTIGYKEAAAVVAGELFARRCYRRNKTAYPRVRQAADDLAPRRARRPLGRRRRSGNDIHSRHAADRGNELNSRISLLLSPLRGLFAAGCADTSAPPPAVTPPSAEMRYLVDPRIGFEGTTTPKIAQKFDAAWRFILAGDLVNARKRLAEIRTADPAYLPAMLADAAIALDERRIEDARAAVDRVRARATAGYTAVDVYAAEVALASNETRRAFDLYRDIASRPDAPEASKERFAQLRKDAFAQLFHDAQASSEGSRSAFCARRWRSIRHRVPHAFFSSRGSSHRRTGTKPGASSSRC